LGLKEPDAFAPSAFFLGPNAENIDTLTEMVEIVLKDHAQSRRDYSGDDPDMYSPTVEDEDGSREKTKDAMIDNSCCVVRCLCRRIEIRAICIGI